MALRRRPGAAQALAGLLLLSCGITEGGRDLGASGTAGDAGAEAPGEPENAESDVGASDGNDATSDASGSGERPDEVMSDADTPTRAPVGETASAPSWRAHQLADFARCGDAELSQLAAACSDSEQPQTLVTNDAELSPASVSLLELTGPEDMKRGSVEFTPSKDQTFGIYLGTPNVPLSISVPTRQVMPRCARYLAPELSRRLTGAECSQLRGVYLLDLQGGVTYTFGFGPIAPQQWLRIYVQPLD
jgi:hypothetical protein